MRERIGFNNLLKPITARRTTIINDLIAAGFQIEQMAEPMLAEQPQWHDEFKDLRHRPLYCLLSKKSNKFDKINWFLTALYGINRTAVFGFQKQRF